MVRVALISPLRLSGFAALMLCSLRPVAAVTITLDTTTAPWAVSGGGATDATPFVVGGGISITSNTFQTGTFISGGSAANFDGFWTASLSFFLPANATNVVLNFSNLQADDRTIFELNGTEIGSAGIFGPGAGQMVFTDGGPLVDNVSFGGIPVSGSANSGFALGASNTLFAIVNDTGTGISGPLNGSHSFETIFVVDGTVTYDIPVSGVPEPSSGVLSLMAGSLLLLSRKFGTKATER
jgi:hypothetical protein